MAYSELFVLKRFPVKFALFADLLSYKSLSLMEANPCISVTRDNHKNKPR